MSITFLCEHCRKEIKAPDTAGGKRGKCPFCGDSTYIPTPVSEEDIIPLADEDEEAERRDRELRLKLIEQEKELLHETGGDPEVPLDQRDDVKAGDLQHFVINYCMDMANGKLDRAETNARKLRSFGPPAFQALEGFINHEVSDPALKSIPTRVLDGFLVQLRDKMRK